MSAAPPSDATPDPLQAVLNDVHAQVCGKVEGQLADYIPELARVNPDDFGLAIMTAKGRLCTVGDVDVPFTIQSVAKAFTYCIALEILGAEGVQARVGVEPSGDAFNAIEFDPVSRRPYNPMVNAGAIAVAGILRDAYQANALEKIVERFSLAAGRKLDIDQSVFRSEQMTGYRNRAIGHLLCAAGLLDEPIDDAVDLYFQLCSIRVTARDLATMAATLSNMGANPTNAVEVFDFRAVRSTLSVMLSCGMYNFSGKWTHDVGIPAKSGVGGGLIGVVNRQVGIGAFSPRLDAKGNSVRGVHAMQILSDELGLHAFECTNAGSSFIEHLL
jgi:glutaminase